PGGGARGDDSARGDAGKGHRTHHRHVVEERGPRCAGARAAEGQRGVHRVRGGRPEQLPAGARALAAVSAAAGDQPAGGAGGQQGGHARRGAGRGHGARGRGGADNERVPRDRDLHRVLGQGAAERVGAVLLCAEGGAASDAAAVRLARPRNEAKVQRGAGAHIPAVRLGRRRDPQRRRAERVPAQVLQHA
ncbi:hypothetical protein H4R23_006963, partial [Coemansia sp. Cherry 401B]